MQSIHHKQHFVECRNKNNEKLHQIKENIEKMMRKLRNVLVLRMVYKRHTIESSVDVSSVTKIGEM